MSAAACTMFIGWRVIITLIGASIEVMVSWEDDPMCRQTTVPVSDTALQNGSQCSLWKLGHPSFSGFSENVTARQPLAATRWTSAAMASGSHTAGRARGMNRPGCDPHHSSMCQSL